jgi:hypothetical protein
MPGSLPMLIAPLATWLHYRFSARLLANVGIVMTALSLLATSAVERVGVMLIVHGIVSGFGLMCVVNPPFFLLEQYFPYEHKHHVLATSLIACGFPLGMISLPTSAVTFYLNIKSIIISSTQASLTSRKIGKATENKVTGSEVSMIHCIKVI